MIEMTQSRIAQPVVRRGLMVLGADLIYVFVPVIVTVFVICEKAGRFRNVISSPEWAFAAAILIGQAGAKLLAGAAVERNLSWQPLVLIAALLFMLEAMALTVLLLLLTSEGHSGLWLAITQLALFLLSIPIYLSLGLLSHAWRSARQQEE